MMSVKTVLQLTWSYKSLLQQSTWIDRGSVNLRRVAEKITMLQDAFRRISSNALT
jgi:hypothetical protein